MEWKHNNYNHGEIGLGHQPNVIKQNKTKQFN